VKCFQLHNSHLLVLRHPQEQGQSSPPHSAVVLSAHEQCYQPAPQPGLEMLAQLGVAPQVVALGVVVLEQGLGQGLQDASPHPYCNNVMILCGKDISYYEFSLHSE
jgi:hypothetical protein